jgi:hypothetical protein
LEVKTLVHEHSIRAALHAEAAGARVDTEALLKRIRQGASVNRRSFRRFWPLVKVAAACALLSLLFLLPRVPGGQVPSAAPAGAESADVTSRLLVLENETLGVRVAYPVSFDTPEIDAQGRLALRYGALQITIVRQELLPEGAAVITEPELGQPVEVGQRMLNGRKAQYMHFPTAEVYAVPVEQHEYVIRCGPAVEIGDALWAGLQPVCDRVLSSLELGVKFGISREEAETAAVSAVADDVVVVKAVLEGHGDETAVPPPVWRLFLATRGDGREVGSVTVDYRSGKVLTVEVKKP